MPSLEFSTLAQTDFISWNGKTKQLKISNTFEYKTHFFQALRLKKRDVSCIWTPHIFKNHLGTAVSPTHQMALRMISSEIWSSWSCLIFKWEPYGQNGSDKRGKIHSGMDSWKCIPNWHSPSVTNQEQNQFLAWKTEFWMELIFRSKN